MKSEAGHLQKNFLFQDALTKYIVTFYFKKCKLFEGLYLDNFVCIIFTQNILNKHCIKHTKDQNFCVTLVSGWVTNFTQYNTHQIKVPQYHIQQIKKKS